MEVTQHVLGWKLYYPRDCAPITVWVNLYPSGDQCLIRLFSMFAPDPYSKA